MTSMDARTARPAGGSPITWTLGLAAGTDRIVAATWTAAGIEELRLDGAALLPRAFAALEPGAPSEAAERALSLLLEQFVAVGRHRYGLPPAAVTAVLAWDPASPQSATTDRVLGAMLPGARRRVIGAPAGSPGSPETGHDPEPARMAAMLGGDAVTAALAQPPVPAVPNLPAVPAPDRTPGSRWRGAVATPVVVAIAVVAALLGAAVAFVPLQVRQGSEQDRVTAANDARRAAEQKAAEATAKLADVGGFDLASAGTASLAGDYTLKLPNTACIAFDECGALDLTLAIAPCAATVCLTGKSTEQSFTGVRVTSATSGVSATGDAVGYTCQGDPIDDATWRLNIWPAAASYIPGSGSWDVTSIAVSFVVETVGSTCRDGLLAWSGASAPGARAT